MTDSELEELQLQVEGGICKLPISEMEQLAEHVGLESKEYKGKSKLAISKVVRAKVEDELGKTENKVEYLTELQNFTAGTPPPLEEIDKEAKEESVKMKLEYEALCKQFQEMMESYKKKMEQASVKLEDTKPSTPATAASKPKEGNVVSLVDVKTALRRDFKIMGAIGGEEQKDRLSFVSLIRQIDAGMEKGYKEREIIDAVIRAISPSLKLRSYLETMKELTLAKLRQMLRAHYKQKSGTELYQELTTMCQSPKETPQDFLIRALDLRQQVLFASQAEGGIVKYEPSLVHPLFLHAIETGLQDEAVRNKLRPFLQKAEITDEELMEKINVVVSEESERKDKLGATYHKNVRVNSLEVDRDQAEVGSQTQPKKSGSKKEMKGDRPDRLMVTLEAVQSDIAVLKEAMASQNVSERERVQHRYPFGNQRRRVCQACQRANQEFCDHCFRCGSSDHFARGCRSGAASVPNQGNRRRLPPRDRE